MQECGHLYIDGTSPRSKLSGSSDTFPADDDSSSESYSSDDSSPRLVKPMPVLAVCPMADSSPVLLDKPGALMRVEMPPLPLNMTINSPPSTSPPQNLILKRDPLAIRQQYWSQLGINVSVRDVERSTGRRRINREGIRVKLNDVNTKPKSRSLFKVLSRWVRNDTSENDVPEEAVEAAIAATEDDSESDATPPKETIWLYQQGRLTPPKNSTLDGSSTRKKRIKFADEAVLYYIPLHRELSKRQRDSMWYTREEFITMVERNLDEMYEEMEREYEQQVKMEAMENDMMAAEEAYTRRIDLEIQKHTESLLQQQIRTAALLQQHAQQIKVTPRGSKEIRFKYLKHLGIHNN